MLRSYTASLKAGTGIIQGIMLYLDDVSKHGHLFMNENDKLAIKFVFQFVRKKEWLLIPVPPLLRIPVSYKKLCMNTSILNQHNKSNRNVLTSTLSIIPSRESEIVGLQF